MSSNNLNLELNKMTTDNSEIIKNIVFFTILFGLLIILIIIYFIYKDRIYKDKLTDIPPTLPNTFVKTLPTIKQQTEWNNKFMTKYNKFIESENKRNNEENIVPFMWNENNSLDSMKLFPNLSNETNRMTCHTAPEWWYPKKEYDPNNFRTIYYGDYFNPVYNFLGNAQEMFWDFRSVRNS